MPEQQKNIYFFGNSLTEGNASMKKKLGNKGAGLAEMSNIGIPIPPGFTVCADLCFSNFQSLSEAIKNEIIFYLKLLEKKADKNFGSTTNPLLLSVRSGSVISMPGMMDTILNLGINEPIIEALTEKNGIDFARSILRRFVEMYVKTVLHLNENEINIVNKVADNCLSPGEEFAKTNSVLESFSKGIIPSDPLEQLLSAIRSVFASWLNPRAITYRKINALDNFTGTAVTVQSMVFGNFDENSATGVMFTRNPATGEKELYGDYLRKAQGEEIVSGTTSTSVISIKERKKRNINRLSMEEEMPEIFSELARIGDKLERHFKDMQDVEFTVESGKLYILQTRDGKRTTVAAAEIAQSLIKENIASEEDVFMKINPYSLDKMMHNVLESDEIEPLTQGLPASPGAVSGSVVFYPEDAEKAFSIGKKTILIREETSPDDISGINAAEGILTARGGMTSHAAVVTRGMGKPCICGANEITINQENKEFSVGGKIVREGEFVTIDGSSGKVFEGILKTKKPEMSSAFTTLNNWADKNGDIKIYANADTPEDIDFSLKNGANGIGLCRTEHMFFEKKRIIALQCMIVCDGDKKRNAIHEIGLMQTEDFKKIFISASGKPVNIRLLDPPLHEFLPNCEASFKRLSDYSGITVSSLKRTVHVLRESNPMLGQRGCRLGIIFPEIYEMQIRSVVQAARSINLEKKIHTDPGIMVPFVMSTEEALYIKKIMLESISEYDESFTKSIRFGVMIELPRAALIADELAEISDFFSFGTNDMTQTAMGLSRDDSSSILSKYDKVNIMKYDPFIHFDEKGIGELLSIAMNRGLTKNPSLSAGICGEHAAHPRIIPFSRNLGMTYASCSAYRIPIMKLAAAQEACREKLEKKSLEQL